MSVVVQDAVAERVHKWLGSLPSDWAGARLFEVADAWTSNVDKHTVEGQPTVRLCNYVDVYKNDSIVDSLDFMTASATREQIDRFRIRVGDTLITKDSETADDIGIPAFVEYEAEDLICGYHLAIVRPDRRKAVPKFLYWALRSEPIARQWGVTAAGVTRVGIRSTDLSKITIPLPPLDAQRAIAEYLDHETAQIDALVAKQREFIGLLGERRSAEITRAVTRGLDDRVPLNDSGVPSLGLIPAHWAVKKIKHLGRALIGLTYSPAQIVGEGEGGTLVLRSGNIQHGQLDLTDNVYVDRTIPNDLRIRVGDILICARNGSPRLIGKNAILDSSVSGQTWGAFMAVLRSPVNGYLRWVLNSQVFAANIGLFTTTTVNQLTNSTLHNLDVALPPPSEQLQIARHLDEQTSRIDALIAKAEELIGLAQERRSALITAAVTGQIDVRTAAGKAS